MKNLPNILSSIRILMAPVFVLVYFAGVPNAHLWAAAVFLAAALTDFLDGFIARRYGCISNLGKVLDPAGDKLMTLSMVSCLAVDGIIPGWMPWFFLAKEILMTFGSVFYRSRISSQMPGSNIIGKTATFALFCVGLSLMLFKVSGKAAYALMGVTVILSLAALISYAVTFLTIWRKNKNTN